LIWGKRDPYLPLWLAERQHAFPSAQQVVLPNSGHFLVADDPQAVRAAILPFLRQQLTASR
jgi:pimeloyl-ACP methyl ester carboxylesterase